MVGVRQQRAIALIAGAVIALTAASFAYLHPASSPQPRTATGATGVQWTEAQLVQNINLKGRTDGGYFVWTDRRGSSGGHAG